MERLDTIYLSSSTKVQYNCQNWRLISQEISFFCNMVYQTTTWSVLSWRSFWVLFWGDLVVCCTGLRYVMASFRKGWDVVGWRGFQRLVFSWSTCWCLVFSGWRLHIRLLLKLMWGDITEWSFIPFLTSQICHRNWGLLEIKLLFCGARGVFWDWCLDTHLYHYAKIWDAPGRANSLQPSLSPERLIVELGLKVKPQRWSSCRIGTYVCFLKERIESTVTPRYSVSLYRLAKTCFPVIAQIKTVK